MSLDERVSRYESKRERGERLLAAQAYEEARIVLSEAKAELEDMFNKERQALDAELDQACSVLYQKQLERGDYYLAEGNLELAKDCLTTARELARARHDRDEVDIRLGQIEQKATPSQNLEQLSRKVASSTDSPEILFDFGTELALEGYLPEAIRYLERVTELTPDDPVVFFTLANAYQDTERYREARAAYDKAMNLGYEDRSEVFYRLGMLAMAAEGSHVEAKRHFKKALEVRGDHSEALRELAHLCAEEYDLEGAQEYLKAAIGADPDDPSLHVSMGKILEQGDRIDEAKAAYKKAIAIDKEDDAAQEAQDALDRIASDQAEEEAEEEEEA